MAGGYGAVSTKNPDDENSFDEYENSDHADFRYIPERPLTVQERVRKWVSAGVPIVIAIVLMLGFGWWTTNALTPRHGSSVVDHASSPAQSVAMAPFPTPTIPTVEVVVADPETSSSGGGGSSSSETSSQRKKAKSSTTTTESSSGTASTSNSRACTDNPGCSKLGLIGDCCPTPDGVQLGCCL